MAKFKVDMHNLYIRAQKDPKQTWVKLLFIVRNDTIYEVLTAWPLEWHAPDVALLERIVA